MLVEKILLLVLCHKPQIGLNCCELYTLVTRIAFDSFQFCGPQKQQQNNYIGEMYKY